MPTIRGYRSADRDAVYDICVRTGAAGTGAEGRYSSDDLLGDLFAGPYLTLEPGLAFVLEDDGSKVIGYVLGTADTARFALRWAVEWAPRLAARYPPPHAASDAHLLAGGAHPERMLVPELADHPAHLHIDLLPEAQGRGFGRQLIDTFCAAVGVGVHLGVSPANTKALGFYARLGFRELPTPDDGVVYLVRP